MVEGTSISKCTIECYLKPGPGRSTRWHSIYLPYQLGFRGLFLLCLGSVPCYHFTYLQFVLQYISSYFKIVLKSFQDKGINILLLFCQNDQWKYIWICQWCVCLHVCVCVCVFIPNQFWVFGLTFTSLILCYFPLYENDVPYKSGQALPDSQM